MNRKEIITSFAEYVSITNDNMQDIVELIVPMNKEDKQDLKILKDFLNTITQDLKNATRLSQLGKHIDLDLLMETWADTTLPYLTGKKIDTDCTTMSLQIDELAENIQNGLFDNEE